MNYFKYLKRDVFFVSIEMYFLDVYCGNEPGVLRVLIMR